MAELTDPDKLLRFFKQTLNDMPPVAAADLYYDKQCRGIIRELEQLQGPVELLDYGCGNLRLLNAIKNTKVKLPEINYTGTDIQKPDAEAGALLRPRDHFQTIKKFRDNTTAKFDVIVLMNVIHEIALFEIASIFEDIRRFLKPGGIFLLVDMSVLPEGEPLALPFFSWEFDDLFKAYGDKSYSSNSGIPVVFLVIKRENIHYFPHTIKSLKELVQVKRNTFSDIACRLNDPTLHRRYEHLMPKLSLSGDKVYDLGKLMLMSGHANYRWVELVNRGYPNHHSIGDSAIGILRLFLETFHQSRKLMTPGELFQELGKTCTYESLATALEFMSQFGGFFFPVRNPDEPLTPTESLEAFEDHYDYEDVRKMGLGLLQERCKNWIDGEYPI